MLYFPSVQPVFPLPPLSARSGLGFFDLPMKTPGIIAEQVDLSPLTTMRLGGPARYLARCGTADEIRTALDWAAGQRLPVQVLGGGSNTLFDDGGYRGLVLKLELSGVRFEERRRQSRGERPCRRGLGRSRPPVHRPRAFRHRVPLGHPGAGRGRADAERRRLRPGGRRHHRCGARHRPRHPEAGGVRQPAVRFPLPQQPLQERGPRPLRHHRGGLPPRGRSAAGAALPGAERERRPAAAASTVSSPGSPRRPQ